jgi:Mg2+ and Co2+ transporter CorA
MLTAYLFDHKHGEKIEEWASVARKLRKNHLLWVDLTDPSDDEERAVRDGFDLADAEFRASASEPEFEQGDGYIRVTAIAVSDEETDADREAVVVDCFIGQNWIVTA